MTFNGFEKKNILCLGDIILDRFVYGTVDRVSPEAPIPIMHIKREFSVLGGAGNVVRNIASLGGSAILVGLTGEDAVSLEIQDLFDQQPEVTAYLVKEQSRKTPVKSRFIASGQQLLRTDDETVITPKSEAEYQLVAKVAEVIGDCSAVILSDYAKGLLTPFICQKVIALAHHEAIPVIVDPKGYDFRKYQGATLISPNLLELKQYTPMPITDEESLIQAARQLQQQCDTYGVLVTRGGQGMTLVEDGDIYHHIPATALEVFDVSGAGDTVVATLTLALANGMSTADAARIANAAAGIAVGKIGTATVSNEELMATYKGNLPSSTHSKICSKDTLAEKLKLWRREGLCVGFTNGCYDLLHTGHLHLLEQARAQVDRLIVGINSDDSVKRLKGESRPIHSEVMRAKILSALEVVDAVILFEEETPLRLIKEILPDVLIKGADYALEQVVGADVVHAHGGRVFLADLMPGQSTTSTLERLLSVA